MEWHSTPRAIRFSPNSACWPKETGGFSKLQVLYISPPGLRVSPSGITRKLRSVPHVVSKHLSRAPRHHFC